MCRMIRALKICPQSGAHPSGLPAENSPPPSSYRRQTHFRLGQISFSCQSHPVLHNEWQPFCDLVAEQDFVHIPHVKHVDDSTEIRPTIIPPGVEIVDQEVMFDVDSFVLSKFLKFHPIEQRLVHPIGHPAPKCCRKIVFLDLPNGNWI